MEEDAVEVAGFLFGVLIINIPIRDCRVGGCCHGYKERWLAYENYVRGPGGGGVV